MECAIRASDARQFADPLTRFDDLVIELLTARGADDILDLAQRAFADALGVHVKLRAAAELCDSAPATETDAIACIPLAWESHLLGAVLVGNDVSENDLNAPELARMTRLFGAALAAHARAAEELAQQIQEASQLRFDVVSMLSHEMRTPLAAIKGYVSALLLDDVEWDSAVRVEFLQTIEDETDHLTALVTDVLDTAAMDAGELRIQVAPIDIPEIARRVVGKLSIQTEIHRLVLSFPAGFPTVQADAARIEQVLTNLIDNAIKYSPDGGLVVVRGEVRPDEVVVSVTDQGIGIAPEDLNKLFERFFRASPDRRGRIGGTGLGLPIADSIIRAHGGRIWAESVMGSGTTLSFALPLAESERAR